MLHVLDYLAHGIMRIPRLVPRLFPDGWGDETALAVFRAERRDPPQVAEIDVDWNGEGDRRLGSFLSPSPHLPAAARRGRVLWIGPDHSAQVVLLAASNDHGWTTRETVARGLNDRGIGSLILENPYYGARRVRSGQALPTVTDFFRMGSATVAEARALLAYTVDLGYTPGVAGFSQGGSMAAYVSALAPCDVATACMAAGPSPGPVFTSGVLATTVDWRALGGRDEALPKLRAELDDVSVTRYAPAPHTTAAVVAGGRRDAYVAAADVVALAQHWEGSELVWLDGGHASFHLFGKDTQATVIARSFQRFARFSAA